MILYGFSSHLNYSLKKDLATCMRGPTEPSCFKEYPFCFRREKKCLYTIEVKVFDESKQTKMDGHKRPNGKILLSGDLDRGSTDACLVLQVFFQPPQHILFSPEILPTLILFLSLLRKLYKKLLITTHIISKNHIQSKNVTLLILVLYCKTKGN